MSTNDENQMTLEFGAAALGRTDFTDPPDKIRVGSFFLSDAIDHPAAGTRTHRPLSPGSFVDFITDDGNIYNGVTDEPVSSHVHLAYCGNNTTFQDTASSNDVVVRFDPYKQEDLTNYATPTGHLMRALAISKVGYQSDIEMACPDFEAMFPNGVENITTEQLEQFYQALTEYYANPESLDSISTNYFFGEEVSVGGEVYLVPEAEQYPELKIKHHDKIVVEFPPGVDHQIVEQDNGSYQIQFLHGDGVIVGGYNIHKKSLVRPENIEFRAVEYSSYSALEKGRAGELVLEEGLHSKLVPLLYDRQHQNDEKIPYKQEVAIKDRIFDQYLHNKYIAYGEVMQGYAEKYGMTTNIERYQRAVEILKTDEMLTDTMKDSLLELRSTWPVDTGRDAWPEHPHARPQPDEPSGTDNNGMKL